MPDVLNLVAQMADGVFAIDSAGRIILWNRSAQKTLGYRPKEVLGKYCYEVLPGRDSAGNLFCFKGCSVLAMVRQGEPVRNYDLQVLTKTGRRVWLNLSILNFPAPKRNRPIIIHFFRPVRHPQGTNDLVGQVTAAVRAALKNGDGSSSAESWGPSLGRGPSASLTRRETEILVLMARCLRSQEIADRFHISHATVRTHIQNILGKLKVHSKLEAVALAFREGLLQDSFSGKTVRSAPLLRQLQD